MNRRFLSLAAAAGVLCCLALTACHRGNVPSGSQPATSTAPLSTTATTSTKPTASVTTSSRRTTTKPPSTTTATTTSSSTTTRSPASVSVTIPAGATVVEIAQLLDDRGVCTQSMFLNIAQNYTFKGYTLLEKMPASNRYFKLEGYLYPGEYVFTQNMPAQQAISLMLNQAERQIAGQYNYTEQDAASGGTKQWTVDQIITLASILEAESDDPAEMRRISSVLHNRRRAKLLLQADSTVTYLTDVLRPGLSGNVSRFDSYYNTYDRADLPVGPIGSPSADALFAAVNPESTLYLYYFRDSGGAAHFALTEAEYLRQRDEAHYTPPTLPSPEPTTTIPTSAP